MEIFSKPIISLWNKCEIRVLVLLSLLWQVILIILGSRRKYLTRATISWVVWVTYLSADWLATVSLGNLATADADSQASKTEGKDQVIKALWAPFLLLHLGGPDTISAYAIEDNNLWLRHLLGLIVQVIVAFYIFLRSWGNDALTLIAIPVFLSGIIKYSERTWALRVASPEKFEDSISSSSLINQQEGPAHLKDIELECVHKGYLLFPLLKRLYADLSLTFADGEQSSKILMSNQDEKNFVFKLIEVQLGFLYDALYTKAQIMYTRKGLILRLISVSSMVSALIAFIFVIDNSYSKVDISITYTLFIGAVSLEAYAFVSLVGSDWTLRWMTAKQKKSRLLSLARSCNRCCRAILFAEGRWSGSMAQHNLIDLCLANTPASIRDNLLSKLVFKSNLFLTRKRKQVDNDMKKLIFDALQKKYKTYEDSTFSGQILKDLLTNKANEITKEYTKDTTTSWSFEVEFDHSILLWHVATDICYYSSTNSSNPVDPSYYHNREASKKLSDYFLYILLICPSMLPKWIDRTKNVRDTFDQAIKLFHRRNFPVKGSDNACKMLVQLHTQYQVLELLRKENVGMSVLLDACHLSLQLQNSLEGNKLWDMVCDVWIEMLIYAASRGDWGPHAQQLRTGGELLTHVALLMANLGLSEHIDTTMKGPPMDTQNQGWGWAITAVEYPC